MPGDPQECRQRALNCMLLAKEASDAQAKQMFLDLAQSWSRLAAELEDTQAFLNTLRGMEFKDLAETHLSDEANQPDKAA
jgi:hypothetical protein